MKLSPKSRSLARTPVNASSDASLLTSLKYTWPSTIHNIPPMSPPASLVLNPPYTSPSLPFSTYGEDNMGFTAMEQTWCLVKSLFLPHTVSNTTSSNTAGRWAQGWGLEFLQIVDPVQMNEGQPSVPEILCLLQYEKRWTAWLQPYKSFKYSPTP